MYDEGALMTEERLLIERAQKGDKHAFRELVETAKENVFRLAYDLTGNRHDAEDLSQEVFIKAFRALPRFRGDARWSSWLYRITVNTCYDHNSSLSRKKIDYRDDLENEEIMEIKNFTPGTKAPDGLADSSLIQAQIETALHELTTPERSVFILRQYHDLQLKQIAGILEVTEGTVKTLLFRSIRKLQQKLSFYKTDIGLER
jgi:RNA polymerase sigma-70 factor (ECF subfamily)